MLDPAEAPRLHPVARAGSETEGAVPRMGNGIEGSSFRRKLIGAVKRGGYDNAC